MLFSRAQTFTNLFVCFPRLACLLALFTRLCFFASPQVGRRVLLMAVELRLDGNAQMMGEGRGGDGEEEEEEEDEFFEASEEIESCSPRTILRDGSDGRGGVVKAAVGDGGDGGRRETGALQEEKEEKEEDVREQTTARPKLEVDVENGEDMKDYLEAALRTGRLTPRDVEVQEEEVNRGGSGDDDNEEEEEEEEGEPSSSSSRPEAAVPSTKQPQHLRIYNLDTGEEFTLAREGDAASGESTPLPNIMNSKTGETCSLEEFERSLGLSPLMREMERRRKENVGGPMHVGDSHEDIVDESDDDDDDSMGDAKTHDHASVAASAGTAASKEGRNGGGDDGVSGSGSGSSGPASKKPLNPGRWVKKRISERFVLPSFTRVERYEKAAVGPIASESQSRLGTPVGQSPNPASAGAANTIMRSSVSMPANGVHPVDRGRPSHMTTATTSGKEAAVGDAVRVSVHRKIYKEFTRLELVQEMKGHVGAVWCMKFSYCGAFLASAGQDTTVRVWKLLPQYVTEESVTTTTTTTSTSTTTTTGAEKRRVDRSGTDAMNDGENSDPNKGSGAPADIVGDDEDDVCGTGRSATSAGSSSASTPGSSRRYFQDQPHRTYVGHKADVLDLCWSKSQFLLSSSMDKSVRLWHISMDGCLRIFSHNDFVTAIDFNPADDKFFLSGSLDEKLRIWNIPDHAVADSVDVHEMVTSACYSSDGKQAIVGSYRGKCRFYSAENAKLEYVTQIEVRNTRGKNSRGKKITGLQVMPNDPKKLLVTSNDSRVRIFDGYNLRCKYKGLKNSNSQIRASFNAVGDFIICGSEDGCVYIWSTINTFIPTANPTYTGFRRDKQPAFESFEAHDDIVTVAVFVPKPRLRPMRGKAKPTKAAAALMNVESLRTPDALATAEGEVAMASAAGLGQMVVTTGYSGEIKLWENLGSPCWV